MGHGNFQPVAAHQLGAVGIQQVGKPGGAALFGQLTVDLVRGHAQGHGAEAGLVVAQVAAAFFDQQLGTCPAALAEPQHRHPAVDIDEVFDAKSDENTEEEIISKVSSDEIKRALRDLSDNDYDIMFLYLIKELTPSEIAQLLGITGGQARQKIFRARQRLIKHLEKRGITNET